MVNKYIRCECKDPLHFLHLEYIDGSFFVTVHVAKRTLWERVKAAFGILRGNQDNYIEVCLNDKQAQKFIDEIYSLRWEKVVEDATKMRGSYPEVRVGSSVDKLA